MSHHAIVFLAVLLLIVGSVVSVDSINDKILIVLNDDFHEDTLKASSLKPVITTAFRALSKRFPQEHFEYKLMVIEGRPSPLHDSMACSTVRHMLQFQVEDLHEYMAVIGIPCLDVSSDMSEFFGMKDLIFLTLSPKLTFSPRYDMTSTLFVGPNYFWAGNAVLKLFNEMHWSDFGVLYSLDPLLGIDYDTSNGYRLKVLEDLMGHMAIVRKPKDITLPRVKRFNLNRYVDNTISNSTVDYHTMLNDIESKSRIVFVGLEPDQWRVFLLEAHKRGMTNGQYVFIIPMLFDFDLRSLMFLDRPWYIEGDPDNELAKEAFQSVLILRFERKGAAYTNFYELIDQECALEDSCNLPDPPIQSAESLFDALQIVGHAYSELKSAQVTTRNNTRLVAQLMQTRTMGSMGEVSFSQASRALHRSIIFYHFNASTGDAYPIYDYSSSTSNLVPIHPIDWFHNSTLPCGKLECGSTVNHLNRLSFAKILALVLGCTVIGMAVLIIAMMKRILIEEIVMNMWQCLKWHKLQEDGQFTNDEIQDTSNDSCII